MFNLTLLSAQIMIGRLAGFALNALMLVAVVGSILLIATLINKRITKKEQEAKDEDTAKK